MNNCRTETIRKNKEGQVLLQSSALATDGGIILPYAAKGKIREFLKNPVMTAGHPYADQVDRIAGSWAEPQFDDDGLWAKPVFAETQLGKDLRTLYEGGHLNAVSITWPYDEFRETDPAKIQKLLDKHKITVKPDERDKLKWVMPEYRLKDAGWVIHGADPKALKHAADEGNLAARMMLDQEPERKTDERPFGDYKDFDDCVAKNGDKEDPKGYCAAIQKKVEGEKKKADETLTLASIRAAIREEVAAVMAEIGIQAPAPDPVPAATQPEPEPEESELYAGLLDMKKAAEIVAPPKDQPELGALSEIAELFKPKEN